MFLLSGLFFVRYNFYISLLQQFVPRDGIGTPSTTGRLNRAEKNYYPHSNNFLNSSIVTNMPNDLVLSLLPDLQAKYGNNIDRNEWRRSRYGVYDFYKDQSAEGAGIVTAEMKQLAAQSLDRDVSIPVFDKPDITITNTRTCVIPDGNSKSDVITLTFFTLHWGFTYEPRFFINNAVGEATYVRGQIEAFAQKAADFMDTAARNNLEANRNTYFPAAITAFYPEIGDALQITQAQKNDFFNNAEAILNTMDFYGRPNVIGSTTLTPIIRRLEAQGPNNATNEAFQFSDIYSWYNSNRVTNAAGVQATAYLVQDGNVGFVQRLDPDCLARRRSGDGREWDVMQNFPILGIPVDTYFYDSCRDLSSVRASMSRSYSVAQAFAVDIAFVNSYVRDPVTGYAPIVKAEISAS